MNVTFDAYRTNPTKPLEDETRIAIPQQPVRVNNVSQSLFQSPQDLVGKLKARLTTHIQNMSLCEKIFYIFIVVLVGTAFFSMIQNNQSPESCRAIVPRPFNSTALEEVVEPYVAPTPSVKMHPEPTDSRHMSVANTYAKIDPEIKRLVDQWITLPLDDHENQIIAMEAVQRSMRDLYMTRYLSKNQIQWSYALFSDIVLNLAYERTTWRTGLSANDKAAISGSPERQIFEPVLKCYYLANNGNPESDSEQFKTSFDHLLALYTSSQRLMNATTLEKIVVDYFMIICERENKPSLMWGKDQKDLALKVFSFKNWREYMFQTVENLLKK